MTGPFSHGDLAFVRPRLPHMADESGKERKTDDER